MKTAEEQPEQRKQLNFYRQRLNASPTNKSNSNYLKSEYSHKPLISKLEINFPKIKICESRKCLTDESISFETQEQIQSPFSNFNLKQHIPDNNNLLTANYFGSKNSIDNDTLKIPNKSQNLSSEQYSCKRERSPVRYNECSYQETTKEDQEQNNTPSYQDFFKVPIQLHNNSIETYNAFIPSIKDLNSKNIIQQHKNEGFFSKETYRECQSFQNGSKTAKINTFQPLKYESVSQKYKIEEPIKQKGNLTLSQLLIDLQKRSQQLYQIYGQNNEDYQKCIDNMESNQKLSSINNKPFFVEQQQRQKQEKYQNNYVTQYQKNSNLGPSYNRGYDWNKKYLDTKEQTLNFFDETIYQAQTKKHPQPQKKDAKKEYQLFKQNYQHKPYQNLTYTSIRQKSIQNTNKPYESVEKKDSLTSQIGLKTSTIKGIISTSKSLSKESSVLEKKKKVMFFNEDDRQKDCVQQKASKFAIFLLRFFNKFLLNVLRSNYFYETGFLSTESNIHAISGRNIEELQDKSKDSNKETSFFQEYLQKRDKIGSQDIVCNMMGGGVKNGKQVNKAKKEEIVLPDALLPIEEQIESSYGLSMISSQKKKIASVAYQENKYYEKEKVEKLSRKPAEQQADSRYILDTNPSYSHKAEELMINSVDKTVFKNQMTSKKQSSIKKREINIENLVAGFNKVSEILKYKVLTQLRSVYLIIKFANPALTEKLGISSLKISKVGNKSMGRQEKQILKHSNNLVLNGQESNSKTKMSKLQPNSNVSQPNSLQPLSKSGNQTRPDPPQAKNILDHYYKKSSPNSQTNEYASIIEEPKQRIEINSGCEGQRDSKNIIVSQSSTRFKQSEFLPFFPAHPTVSKQDYYQMASQSNQPLQSHISHSRTSRALSSSSSKVTINYGAMPHQLPNSYERIAKEALNGMRQSEIPILSPKNTGNNFGDNLSQVRSMQRKESESKLLKKSQISNKEMHISGMSQNNLTQCLLSPKSCLKNSQMLNRFQISNQYPHHLATIRPLQPEQKQLDYFNLKGKISRSYSENDFKQYYNYSVQQTIHSKNPLTPQNCSSINFPGNQLPHAIRDSNMQSRSRIGTFAESSQNGGDLIRRSCIQDYQPHVVPNMKNSSIVNSSQMMMKSNNMISSGIPLSSVNPAHLREISSNNQNFSTSIHFVNQQTTTNIPLNVRTIRPSMNPSIQKRRSQSLGSFMKGSNSFNGIDQASNTPSMMKQLHKKPYIQLKHQNSIQQKQNYLVPNVVQNMQPPMYHQQVPFNQRKFENRPRVSKSVDQCILRPSSFNGYFSNQTSGGLNHINTIIPSFSQSQNMPSPLFVSPSIQTSHFPNLPTSNFLSPNQYIPNSSTPQKQVEVESEYHLMKNNFQLGEVNNVRNLDAKNANPLINAPTNRSNQLMKGNLNKGSRVKYEEQNLIVNKAIHAFHPNTSNPTNLYKSSQQYPSQQTNNLFQQQRLQSPPLSVPLSAGTIRSTKSPTSPSTKLLTNNHLGTSQIPKPKSPQLIQKAKSPDTIKTKTLIGKSKQSKFSHYGQN